MLNYFSYLVVAWVWMLFHAMFHKYDRVFVQQLSPVMMSAPGVLYKRLRKTPLYTWVLDLWPESLTAAGGINNKYVLGFFRHFVRSEYRHSDKILISSRSFEKSILEYGDYKDKVVYFPQWSDTTLSGSRFKVQGSNLPALPDGFKLMFAGAVGEAHGFECTMEAARLTKEHKEIKWVIVGDGRRLDWVRGYVKEHGLDETVLTLGRFPFKRYFPAAGEAGARKRAGFRFLDEPSGKAERQASSFTFQDRRMLADIWAPLDVNETVTGLRGKLALAGNTWRARWKYRLFTDMNWLRALWIQASGVVFERDVRL